MSFVDNPPLQTRYQQGAAVAQGRFEEVRNLTEWYKQFNIAYSALVRPNIPQELAHNFGGIFEVS